MSRRRSNAKVREFTNFLEDNPIPIPQEYNKKKFSSMDLESIRPMTDNQELLFDIWNDDNNMILAGSAGTGKTFLSMYLSLHDVLDKKNGYEKLIIIRSAVPTREQGFVPGTQEEKNAVYEAPYVNIFNDLFKKRNQYKFLKEAGIVEFHTTAYIRGMTFDNAIIVFDEFQNANYEELATVATRVGTNSKVVFSGDVMQNDLYRKKNDESGFKKFVAIADRVPSFRKVHFNRDDIVRSDFVKEFIIAEETYNQLN